MLDNKSFIAIVPARGGSKRLPGKNLLLLGGKPLLQWTLEAASASKYLDEIIVSSDDPEILSVATENGVSAQLRPNELSSDTAGTVDTVLYALSKYAEDFDYVVLLQPTSPLRNVDDIDFSIEKIIERAVASVTTVVEAEHNPLWTIRLPRNHSLAELADAAAVNKRSQDLPKFFRLNGAVYVVEVSALSKHKRFIQSDGIAQIMPAKRSIDIDTEFDFRVAEAMLGYQLSEGC